MNDTLLCPNCGYAAPMPEFIPPKLTSKFDELAFVMLTVVSVLALLKGLGVIK